MPLALARRGVGSRVTAHLGALPRSLWAVHKLHVHGVALDMPEVHSRASTDTWAPTSKGQQGVYGEMGGPSGELVGLGRGCETTPGKGVVSDLPSPGPLVDAENLGWKALSLPMEIRCSGTQPPPSTSCWAATNTRPVLKQL